MIRKFSRHAAQLGWVILLFCSYGVPGIAVSEDSEIPATFATNQVAVTLAAVDDADGDGISDAVEGSGDSDGDGVPDYLDLDSDNDGLEDRIETADDLDGDGVPNYLDLDSNGNGSFDYYESRVTNTISFLSIAQRDNDNNGQIDASYDFGANGYADELESPIESGERNFTLADTDGDGVHDYRDLDIDNDGSTNLEERVHGPTGDDHVPNDKDPDSDNDGIFDVVEVYGISIDQDRDGKLDTFIDENGDGLSDVLPQAAYSDVDLDGDDKPDAYDSDSDGDGIPDYFENWGFDVFKGGFIISSWFSGVAPQVWPLPNEIRDTDGDGVPDFRDTDSNNNGLSDLVESSAVDANGDGFADAILQGSEIPDTDADGIADFQEFEISVEEQVEDQVEEQVEEQAGGSTTAPESGAATSGGGGCSLVQNGTADPTLLILMFMATVAIARRKRVF